jgi:polyisoprenoid-binding protein YceI
MKPFYFLFFTVFYVFTAAQAQQIVIDESEASIQFLFVDDDVDGTMSDFNFTGSIDLDNLESSNFSGSVAMESLDTDNWFRDRHLRSKKYFNNKAYPRLSFKSSSVSDSGNEFLVRGNLTIKNISKPVSFTFKKLAGKLRGTGVINASDFDIFIHDDSGRNMVDVTITLPYSTN